MRITEVFMATLTKDLNEDIRAVFLWLLYIVGISTDY